MCITQNLPEKIEIFLDLHFFRCKGFHAIFQCFFFQSLQGEQVKNSLEPSDLPTRGTKKKNKIPISTNDRLE